MKPISGSYDVVVVGGSFAGLSAALMLARGRKRVLLVDGGRPRNRFAAAAHGVIGHDGTSPAELLGTAVAQLMMYPSVSLKVDLATGIVAHGDRFTLTLAGGEQVEGRKVVLATGITDVLPDIPGVRERWGTSVLHCPYCHGFEVADRPLGVLGTSAHSLQQTLLIPEWGPTTYFTQGRFEPDGEQRRRMHALGVTIEATPVAAFEGPGRSLDRVLLADGRTIPLGAMFLAAHFELTSDLAIQLGCELENRPMGSFVKVDTVQQTRVPGVFAAGDMATAMQSAPSAIAAGSMAGLGAHRALMEDEQRRMAAMAG